MVKVEFRDGSAPPNTKVTTHIWIVTFVPAVRRTAHGWCAVQVRWLTQQNDGRFHGFPRVFPRSFR